ncbi:hypothetical protein SM909_19195 [Klebsiella aerogenes]|uniref:hypothetical protein n=1 Tax=Klebsiella aerogenes TaxID=548 RepID=UPI002A7FAFA0|nr:hypothetical protein [Klebsiella aerogenes]WPR92689.1 hypothetical protein SM909_19195 [Klebsiella aerogenes]
MTDITELAQSWKTAAHKAKQANDLYLEGKITLSECVVETKDYLDYSDNPNNFLALVEALEKAQSANAAQDDHINQQQDRIEQLEKGHQEAAKQINSWRRMAKQNIAEREKDIAELDAARQRIAELESRAVTVKQFDEFQICHYGATEDYAKGYIDCQNNFFKWLTAEGIKWEAK